MLTHIFFEARVLWAPLAPELIQTISPARWPGQGSGLASRPPLPQAAPQPRQSAAPGLGRRLPPAAGPAARRCGAGRQRPGAPWQGRRCCPPSPSHQLALQGVTNLRSVRGDQSLGSMSGWHAWAN